MYLHKLSTQKSFFYHYSNRIFLLYLNAKSKELFISENPNRNGKLIAIKFIHIISFIIDFKFLLPNIKFRVHDSFYIIELAEVPSEDTNTHIFPSFFILMWQILKQTVMYYHLLNCKFKFHCTQTISLNYMIISQFLKLVNSIFT